MRKPRNSMKLSPKEAKGLGTSRGSNSWLQAAKSVLVPHVCFVCAVRVHDLARGALPVGDREVQVVGEGGKAPVPELQEAVTCGDSGTRAGGGLDGSAVRLCGPLGQHLARPSNCPKS